MTFLEIHSYVGVIMILIYCHICPRPEEITVTTLLLQLKKTFGKDFFQLSKKPLNLFDIIIFHHKKTLFPHYTI